MLLCKLFPCSFLMQLQHCRGRLCTHENSAACGTTCARTFVFISSRPTVATVLVCCLLFFSSFCGLSRRCSRRLITWFSPVARRRGRAKEQKMSEGGDKRRSRVKISFAVMSALQSLPLIFFLLYIHTCLVVSRQQAGSLIQLSTGVHFTIGVSGMSSAQT